MPRNVRKTAYLISMTPTRKSLRIAKMTRK
ncbi:unnamed protein product [Dibothriocephalus latus]|uniref:Uncharacterized protein n=1 Tax=Dibothriocephalus latus TaxID=60516 RepID=A0A3P7NRP8_DIBLA|nr:unnamed protein product [Dibothriocephalus latus]